MSTIIAQVTSVGSLIGLVIIVGRKVPVLTGLPETSGPSLKKKIPRFNEIKPKIPIVRDFSLGVFLQKILSKSRILLLRLERKINSCLNSLRQKEKEKEEKKVPEKDYWEELEKTKEE